MQKKGSSATKFVKVAVGFLLVFSGIFVFLGRNDALEPAHAVTTYSSLTYNMQVSMSFDDNYLSGISDDKGTLQFSLSITLTASEGELNGLADGTGTYSSTSYDNGQLSCTGTGTYVSSVAGQSSAASTNVTFGNFGVGTYTYSNNCIADATDNIIYGLIDSCFSGITVASDPTTPACASFPVQGGSNVITENPSFFSYTDAISVSGTAQLTLVSSDVASTSSSSSTSIFSSSTSNSTSTTNSTSSTITSSTGPDCNLTGFGLELFGVRTIRSPTTYLTRVNDSDALFIDGEFFQPALPLACHYSIDVRVTVTITGADDVPINYGAPVTGSQGEQPNPDVPTTWVTLAPPTAPLSRPLGLWQAIATGQVTLSNSTYSVEIGPIFSNVVSFLVQSKAPSFPLMTAFPNGTIIPIPVFGNVTRVTPAVVIDTGGLYTLNFSATGAHNTTASMTMVIAKNLIPTVDNAKWTPAVIVNGLGIPVSYQSPQLIKQCFPICYIAGFFQDADNYYIRINMHFSTNAVKIEFVPPQFSNGQAAAVVLGQPDAVSNQFYVCPACLATTHGVAFDSSGNLWVADAASNRVVRFSPPFTNDMSTNLVIGQPNSTVSTPSTSQAGLRAPYGVAFDSSGDLWVSDAGNNRVLEFKPPFSTGMAASLVIGQSNFTGEAYSNTATGFWAPTALAFDSSGNLWVADFVNSRVLEFSAPFSSGMAASLVLGQADYTSDVFGTTQNAFWAPSGLAFDNAGSLWVSDSGNNRVLEFIAPFTTGMNASLVLGQSSFTASTSTCAATQSAVCSPMGVSFDEWGNLWATDTQNNRVLEFSPPFSTGMNATSVLGQPDFKSGSPSTTAAGLSLYLNAIGLTAPAFDKSGNLWIGDTSNNRVVELIARSNAISTVSTTSTISTVSTLSTLSTSATSSTISTAPEFPQILGTSAVLLTWVVVLAVVGRVLFTYQKHRSNGPP